MTTYDEKLALAKATVILTEEEFANAGGAYFNEDMGLWIRQDADGGGIVPYAWQMDMSRDGAGDPGLITRLFSDMGRADDIKAYSDMIAKAAKERSAYGLTE